MRAIIAAFGFAALIGLTGMQPPAQKKADPPKDTKPAEKKDEPKKADDKKPAAAKTVVSVITVKVPTEKAELMIEKETMKTTGPTREFDTPPLEPGKKFEYTFTVKFAPNNYTTITRVKSVTFVAGDPVTVDLTAKQADDKAVIRWVPTPDDIVTEMVKLAKVGKDDVVYDLGCGDGKIVIAAVKEGNAKKGVGIDIDAAKVKEAKEKVTEAKLGDKVEIREGDALAVKDLADATVVMLYMSDEFGELVKPKLLAGLKPGARVVSHRFTLGDWKPETTKTITGQDGDEYTLHFWTVPAKK